MSQGKKIILALVAVAVVTALLVIGYQRRHNELVAQEVAHRG